MTDSLSVPTATSFREITVDVLDARRRGLNAQLAAAGKKISYTHLIGYAIARAARELPVMTHAFQDVDGKPHRFDPHAVNLGLAVDVEKKDGSHALVVPVIKHAEGMDFAAFHTTYEALVDKARTNKLVPDDFAVPRSRSRTRGPSDGRLGAAPHEGTGLDHRDRRDPHDRQREGHDHHLDLRSPDHPGGRVGDVPSAARRPAAG